MTAETAYVILRNFCVLTATLLVIRNLAWCGELTRVYLAGGDTGLMTDRKHITDEWVVRAGSVLIALVALFGLSMATLEHVVHWLRPTSLTIPTAFMALVCLETLMLWRLIYFAPDKRFMGASIGCLFALSLIVELCR